MIEDTDMKLFQISIIFIHDVSIHIFYLIQQNILCINYCHVPIVKFIFPFQAVYNANRFAKFVRKRDRLQNWLDYYRIKFQKHPDTRPTVKVCNFSSVLEIGPNIEPVSPLCHGLIGLATVE